MPASKAARVRWLINPASSSATAAIRVTKNLPTGPATTVGRSAEHHAGLAAALHHEQQEARIARQPAGGQSRGRSARLPLSTSENSATGMDNVCCADLALRLKAEAGSTLLSVETRG